jgi:hypothetical protein
MMETATFPQGLMFFECPDPEDVGKEQSPVFNSSEHILQKLDVCREGYLAQQRFIQSNERGLPLAHRDVRSTLGDQDYVTCSTVSVADIGVGPELSRWTTTLPGVIAMGVAAVVPR